MTKNQKQLYKLLFWKSETATSILLCLILKWYFPLYNLDILKSFSKFILESHHIPFI